MITSNKMSVRAIPASERKHYAIEGQSQPDNPEFEVRGSTAKGLQEIHEKYTGRIDVMLHCGDFSSARAVIEQAERDYTHGCDIIPIKDVPLVDLNCMEKDTAEIQYNAGVTTIEEFVNMGPYQLCKHQGIDMMLYNRVLRAILAEAVRRDNKRRELEKCIPSPPLYK